MAVSFRENIYMLALIALIVILLGFTCLITGLVAKIIGYVLLAIGLVLFLLFFIVPVKNATSYSSIQPPR